jgi:hypothetical protein
VDIGPSEVANHAIIGNDMDVRILTQRREGAKKIGRGMARAETQRKIEEELRE